MLVGVEFCQPLSMSHCRDPSPRIVVVEDDDSLRAAIERLLRASGYDVLGFEDAETLLATGAAADAACLILDINLPRLSGLDLHDRLCSAGIRAPTIFITAHEHASDRYAARVLRASAYLPKPFPGSTLIDLVKRAVA
jgi:FixJ family two-component response regulator